MSIFDQSEANKQHIGRVIKRNRKRLSITQTELAECLTVATSTITRYESGDIDVPASYLGIISDILSFEPSEYFVSKRKPYEVIDSIAEKTFAKHYRTSFNVSAEDIRSIIVDLNTQSKLENTEWHISLYSDTKSTKELIDMADEMIADALAVTVFCDKSIRDIVCERNGLLYSYWWKLRAECLKDI